MTRHNRSRMPVGRPLADLVCPLLGETMARRGMTSADIALAWPDIVGARLAEVSEPLRLDWPRAGATSGAAKLVIRVEGAFAVEITHAAGLIVERVNRLVGWQCVDRLAVAQGRVERTSARQPRRIASSPAALAAAADLCSDVADPGLREALIRLGSMALRPQDARPGGDSPQSRLTDTADRA
jgi:hypothetical protein